MTIIKRKTASVYVQIPLDIRFEPSIMYLVIIPSFLGKFRKRDYSLISNKDLDYLRSQ